MRAARRLACRVGRAGLQAPPLPRQLLQEAASSRAACGLAAPQNVAPTRARQLGAALRQVRGLADSAAEPPSAGVQVETFSFQSETKRVLDIVTHSLYTEREVFLRELVSNACDALEKARLSALGGGGDPGALEVAITTGPGNTLTVQDTGCGMTKAELQSHLGVIARSGTQEFATANASSSSALIGRFGVGFYSAFMVADRVDVFSRSSDGPPLHWSSDGSGTYTIGECPDDQAPGRGTRIVLHLKPDVAAEGMLTSADGVREVLTRHSAFVPHPVLVDGQRLNMLPAVWTMRPAEVTEEQHTAMYRSLGGTDTPPFKLHFSADAPLSLSALLYVPSRSGELLGFNTGEGSVDDTGISLYCRKVLIQRNAPGLVPRYLRFLRGVVDCEDVPLNIGREALQDAGIVRRLNAALGGRVLKLLGDTAAKDGAAYDSWFVTGGMGMFIREGVCTETDPTRRHQLAKLLRYETTALPPGQLTGLEGAISRSKERGGGESLKAVYYAVSPTRDRDIASPYLEAFTTRGIEVLLSYLPGDEVVFKMLGQLEGYSLVNVEEADTSKLPPRVEQPGDAQSKDPGAATLSDSEMATLCEWLLKGPLAGKVSAVKASSRLTESAAVLTGHMPESLRRLQAMTSGKTGATGGFGVSTTLELNPGSALVRRLAAAAADGDAERQALARMVAEQVLDTARVAAGDIDDPRRMLKRLSDICAAALK
jgi:TNF receptor-associated protein 1